MLGSRSVLKASLLQHRQGLLDAERARRLAGRVLLERREERADDGYGGQHGPQLLTPPAAVEHAFSLVPLPRVLSQVGHHGNVGRILFAGKEVADNGLEVELPGVVTHGHEVGVVAEVEDLAAWPLGNVTLEVGLEVVAVEVDLEGLVAGLEARQEILFHIWLTGCGEKRWQPILVGHDLVDNGAGLDDARPLGHHGHAESTLVGAALLATERLGAAIWPTEDLGAVVAGEHHDRVVRDTEVV